jgi:hypothetical protein
MKLLTFLSLFCCLSLCAQTRFQILDNSSKKPLDKVLIYFGDKNSTYTDVDGWVNISQEYEVDVITAVAHGYNQLTISVSSIENNTVLLKQTDELLPDVIVQNSKKEKITKHKARTNGGIFSGTNHYHGIEYGVFLPKEDLDSNVQLLEITIGVDSKTLDSKKLNKDLENRSDRQIRKKRGVSAKSKKIKFTYLYEVNFYYIVNDTLFTRIKVSPKYIVVSSNQKLYELDLIADRLFADDNGIMIGIKNVGPCDEQGNILPLPRYMPTDIVAPDGRRIKQYYDRENVPQIYLTRKRKDNSVNYQNWHMSDASNFVKLEEGHLGGLVGGAQNQIGLGYKLKISTY